jgi:hypothetical protein
MKTILVFLSFFSSLSASACPDISGTFIHTDATTGAQLVTKIEQGNFLGSPMFHFINEPFMAFSSEYIRADGAPSHIQNADGFEYTVTGKCKGDVLNLEFIRLIDKTIKYEIQYARDISGNLITNFNGSNYTSSRQ